MSDQQRLEQLFARTAAIAPAALTSSKDNYAAEALAIQAEIMEIVLSAPDFHWATTDEGAVHVDPFPNPEEWAIASFGPLKVAVWCGPKGIGIGPEHSGFRFCQP
jgi:hypothetical protein